MLYLTYCRTNWINTAEMQDDMWVSSPGKQFSLTVVLLNLWTTLFFLKYQSKKATLYFNILKEKTLHLQMVELKC